MVGIKALLIAMFIHGNATPDALQCAATNQLV
jgi:hypothetical protein